MISQKKFSLSLDTTTREAYIDYGPPDTTQWKSGETMQFIKMYGTQNPYWQAIADGFYFGDAESTKYTFAQAIGIIDSGWTTLSGPEKEITFIKNYITRNMKGVTVDSSGFTTFSCASYYSSLASVYIRLGGYWIEMRPEDYVVKVGTDSCKILITVNSSFWALGMTVMRGYYITFDIAGDQVGIIPQNDSQKKTLVYDAASDTTATPLVNPTTDTTIKIGTLSISTSAIYATIIIVMLTIIVLLLFDQGPAPTTDESQSSFTAVR